MVGIFHFVGHSLVAKVTDLQPVNQGLIYPFTQRVALEYASDHNCSVAPENVPV